MAKIKVKKESVLKLRFTEHSGQEWELWEKFYLDLVKALAHKGFYLDLSGINQGLTWIHRIHQETAEKVLDKEIIKELAQKHKIEIEFEEKKEEKWIPVHRIVIEYLYKRPVKTLPIIAEIYRDRAKVPSKDIRALIDALGHAMNKSGVDIFTQELTQKAIENLKQQQKQG